jgi:hypothetical protein
MKNDELLSETTTPLIFSFDGLENLPKSKWPKLDVGEGRSGENGKGLNKKIIQIFIKFLWNTGNFFGGVVSIARGIASLSVVEFDKRR